MHGIHKVCSGVIALAAVFLASCSHRLIPDKPQLAKTSFRLDSLPESEINIPVQIDLKPFYKIAEKTVDTVFTSPNWPDGWVQDGCDTRYKYTFRRSLLQMKASGTTLSLGFTGFYRIVGSTRVCVNGAVLSPWTPPCRCGYTEGERRVNVSFQNSLFITPDLKAKLLIQRLEPEPVDKCSVCFWGQDVTTNVMKGLREQLDDASEEMQKKFGSYDLRPKFQAIWDKLNKVYDVYGMGWLQINPLKIRINNLFARNDSLNLYLGLAARPLISFERPTEHLTVAPNISDFSYRTGFNIFVDAILNYDSLDNLLRAQIKDKRMDVSPTKYIVIKDCSVYGMDNENLIIKVTFEGSERGLFYLVGKPTYDPSRKVIELKDLDFDIKSRNMLVKTAAWLFNNRIVGDLKKYARFDLGSYIETAIKLANLQLNREWIKGIQSFGNLQEMKIINIYPLREHLIVRSNCSGNLSVRVDVASFSL